MANKSHQTARDQRIYQGKMISPFSFVEKIQINMANEVPNVPSAYLVSVIPFRQKSQNFSLALRQNPASLQENRAMVTARRYICDRSASEVLPHDAWA